MTSLSDNRRLEVKPNPKDFPALPYLGNIQPGIGAPADSGKSSQERDLEESALGARDGFLLEKPVRVPISAGHKGTKIPGHYYLWALLDGYQGDHDSCWPSHIVLAQNCRRSERHIQRWLDKLERDRRIGIDRKGKFHRYCVKSSRKITTFVFVDPRWVYRLGLSINQAVVLGYVYFRCNHKPEAWFSISEAARALGLSYNTIRRCLAVLAAWDFVKIQAGRLRGGRANRYKPAPFGQLISWENYPNRARPKCPVKRNTPAGQRHFTANCVRNSSFRAEFSLSFNRQIDQSAYQLLVRIGVNRFVARLKAVQWRGDPKSVEQAVINAAAAADEHYRRWARQSLPVPRFNLAGYMVATLNRAHAEGHRVKPSRLALAARGRVQGGARASDVGEPSESELKELEEYAENVLKPSLAKPDDPHKTGVPVKKPQFCDKSAEEEHLRAVQADARARSWQYRKYANAANKLDISVDP